MMQLPQEVIMIKNNSEDKFNVEPWNWKLVGNYNCNNTTIIPSEISTSTIYT